MMTDKRTAGQINPIATRAVYSEGVSGKKEDIDN